MSRDRETCPCRSNPPGASGSECAKLQYTLANSQAQAQLESSPLDSSAARRVRIISVPRRTYNTAAAGENATPASPMTSASQGTPAIAKNGAAAIGATPIRPAQLI